MGGRKLERVSDAQGIVAVHRDLGTLHQERLHEVVGEGVVVVDEQQPHAAARVTHRHTRRCTDAHGPSPAIASARAAEPLIWEGIVVSSEAGARGGLGALSLCKDAKQRLEEALKINDKALNGAHTRMEPNPALGLRAVRYSLSEPKMFMTQR